MSFGGVFSGIKGSAGGGYGSGSTTEMQNSKAALRRAMAMKFVQGWQWQVEADGLPDIDIYVKDITYGAGTVETEARQIGSGEFNKPTYRSAGSITMTVRDDDKQTVAKWFDKQKGKITNSDGTINLPSHYTFKLRVYQLNENGQMLNGEWAVMATQRGECTHNRDQLGEFFSYQLTFTKYSSYNSLDSVVSSNAGR